MKAMVVKDERLFLEDVEMPNVNDDEIRIKVKAIGINRADLLQKKRYISITERLAGVARSGSFRHC